MFYSCDPLLNSRRNCKDIDSTSLRVLVETVVVNFSQRDLTLIRPMLLATEYEVQCAVREAGLPIVKSRCPADGVTVREQTKEFVQERCRTDHAFRQKTLHALQESGIDGWRPVHTGRGSFIVPKKETDHAETTI